MLTDPNVALGLFVWVVLVLHDLLIRDDNRRLRREAEAGALRRAGERMRAAAGSATAGMAGALPYVYGAHVREAARRYEQEVLDAIQEDIAIREDRASREASIHQAIGIDTFAWDEAIDEMSETFERINATTRAAPVDTGDLRRAVDPTRHRCPPEGTDVMPCCGRTPYQVSAYDEITIYDEMVTCGAEEQAYRPAVGHGIRRDRTDEDDETFLADVLDRFAFTAGLAVPFDPDATAPAWRSTADPAPMPEWQAWWTTVTFLRWREALDRDEDRRRAAMMHVAEWYAGPCPAVPCRLCRWLRCRHRGREPVGCEPCREEWHRHHVDMVVESTRDSLAQVGTETPDGVQPVLLVDGPLAGWIVGVRGVPSWETYVGEPFSNLARIAYRREGPSGAIARSLERRPATSRYEPPTRQRGPGAEDRRSTPLPDGCVADVWDDDDEGYAPCGAAVEDQGSLPFCPEHLARLRG